MAQQGSPELLTDPVAEELMSSGNLAKLAYNWTDGSPRVVPLYVNLPVLLTQGFWRARCLTSG